MVMAATLPLLWMSHVRLCKEVADMALKIPNCNIFLVAYKLFLEVETYRKVTHDTSS
jgi:hypothetical protein